MQVRARFSAAAALVLLAPVLLLSLGRPTLERRLHDRLEHEARRRGLVAQIDSVRLGLLPPLALRGVRLQRPGAWALAIDSAEVSWRPLRRAHVALGGVTLAARGDVSLSLVPTEWDVALAAPEGLSARLRGPDEGLSVTWLPTSGGDRFESTASGVPLGRLLTVRHAGAPLLDAGTVTGRALVSRARGAVGFALHASGSRMRLGALGVEAGAGEPPGFGLPTDVAVACEGWWRPETGTLTLQRWAAAVDGATLEGTLSLHDLRGDPRLELSLDVRRVEFARLLRTSGVSEPAAVAVSDAAGPSADLGFASLAARASGRLAEAASWSVTQKLDFTPPRQLPPALLRLRGDFVHEVTLRSGEPRAILVSPESRAFVALRDVPPLFLRTLLLAEDAGFYGHQGVDLRELPAAILTNWQRGGAFRGASTLTQQLAKNLFLSREKRLARKLQELPLALLLEAALDKERLLEIYLNVIEWGPDLFGLRPAARRYFEREPSELTPAQMALLVALIPGPLKYQRALAEGTPAPWFRPLVDDLLRKLRSVDALDEQQLQAALAEPLEIVPARVAAAADEGS